MTLTPSPTPTVDPTAGATSTPIASPVATAEPTSTPTPSPTAGTSDADLASMSDSLHLLTQQTEILVVAVGLILFFLIVGVVLAVRR